MPNSDRADPSCLLLCCFDDWPAPPHGRGGPFSMHIKLSRCSFIIQGDERGCILFFLFFFLFSFFLWIQLGLFLLFLLAFVFFSLVTHNCFSLFEPGSPMNGAIMGQSGMRTKAALSPCRHDSRKTNQFSLQLQMALIISSKTCKQG